MSTYTAKGIPARNDGNIMIRTGLSVLTACGHVISLVRDDANKVATIMVSRNIPSAVASTSLSAAVKMFEARAHRFLTREWRVTPWNGDIDGGDVEAPAKPVPRKAISLREGSGW